jgi:integrase
MRPRKLGNVSTVVPVISMADHGFSVCSRMNVSSRTTEDAVKFKKGMGSIFRKPRKTKSGRKVHDPFYYISYNVGRKRFRECTFSRDLGVAQDLLIKRQREAGSRRFGGDDPEKVTFDDLVALIRADYEQKQNRTLDRVEHAIKHLRPFFEHVPAVGITFDSVSRYITKRLKEPRSSRGTVHKELAALGRMLTLAVHAGRLPSKPHLPTLKLDNVRKGFLTEEHMRAVLAKLPDWYAPAIEFTWRTGWRIGEVKSLTWGQIDWKAGTARLEVGTTKNRDGRVFPFAASPSLAALLRAQRERTDAWQRDHGQIVPWVFWRAGKRLADHRDTWNTACKRAGLPGKLVHDLRRSAVRNLEQANVSRSVAMKLTGHKTEAVYRRYAIVAEADLFEAVRKLESATKSEIGPQSGTEAAQSATTAETGNAENSL